MSVINTLSRTGHLSELASPLSTAEGVLTPLQRKDRVKANLGLTVGLVAGIGAKRLTMPAPATAIDTATLTAAQILNGVLVGTPTAAAAYTMPLAADLVAALPVDFQIGEAFEFSVIDVATTATFDITMTTNTGWTLVGSMVVDANEAAQQDSSGVFRVRRTAAATFTMYRIA